MKIGDWDRTVWRSRNDAEERDSSLLCRWRDGPTRQRLEYHFFEEFLQRHLGMEQEEEEVIVDKNEDGENETEVEITTRREQFISNLDEDDAEDFEAEDEYVIVYGEDPDGEYGEPVQSEPTRDAVREACSDLMGGEYHPEQLFPDRYEEVEPMDVPEDLEETLDDESDVEYEYGQIQDIAKSHDIKANQSTEDLVEALVEVRDAEEIEA